MKPVSILAASLAAISISFASSFSSIARADEGADVSVAIYYPVGIPSNISGGGILIAVCGYGSSSIHADGSYWTQTNLATPDSAVVAEVYSKHDPKSVPLSGGTTSAIFALTNVGSADYTTTSDISVRFVAAAYAGRSIESCTANGSITMASEDNAGSSQTAKVKVKGIRATLISDGQLPGDDTTSYHYVYTGGPDTQQDDKTYHLPVGSVVGHLTPSNGRNTLVSGGPLTLSATGSWNPWDSHFN